MPVIAEGLKLIIVAGLVCIMSLTQIGGSPMKAYRFNDVDIKIEYEGREIPPWQDESEYFKNYDVDTYEVTIKNRETKEVYSFPFYDSIKNTDENEIFHEELIWNIIDTIVLEYNYTYENYPTLEDFISEFGYDIEEEKTKDIYERVTEHAEELNRVLDEETMKKLEKLIRERDEN
ncbi:MAG: hypothetical protein ACOCUI_03130 [bacterium]